ncbi:MAG: LacI family DNA-binding transcriptional regulator [Capsulimonas sp.]|uniref:LacI family DNA-binding transcriptional regulator n=1 Tax=Capsulimonas sp. TaxID=2494211 RepID=UPI0032655882
MHRRPTQADVARLAGVSKSTVGFALSDRYDIAIPETTRQRVKRAALEINYRPNLAARALTSGRMNAITIAFPKSINSYYARVLETFESHSNRHGYHLIASTIGSLDPHKSDLEFSTLLHGPSDAVVLVDALEHYFPNVHEMLSGPRPVISMGINEIDGVDNVVIDLGAGSAAAFRHLIEGGARSMVYFGVNLPQSDIPAYIEKCLAGGDVDPRAVAFCRAARAAGQPIQMVGGDLTERGATTEALEAYIAAHGCPDAIFCHNDSLAIRVHGILRRMGYQMPRDVRLIGCDGVEMCEDMEPPISTILQPVEAMCAAAWDFLLARLAEPTRARQYMRLDTQFIARESSTPRA